MLHRTLNASRGSSHRPRPLTIIVIVLVWCTHFAQSTLVPDNLQASWFTTLSFIRGTEEGVLLSTQFGSEVPLAQRVLDMPTATPFPTVDYQNGFVDFSTYAIDGLLCSGLSNFAWGPSWGISLWIRRTSESESDQIILGNMDSNFQGSFSVYLESGQGVNPTASLAFAFRTVDSTTTPATPVLQKFSGFSLPIGDPFHHFVMTGNGDYVNVYLDNVPVKFSQTIVNQPAKGDLVTSAHAISVGGSLTHGNAVKGHLRNILIYQQFISAQDVSVLFHASIPPTYPPSPVPSASPTQAPSKAPTFSNQNLVSSYFTNTSFDGTVTGLLKDTSGNLRDIAAPTTAQGQFIDIPPSAYSATNQFVNMTFLPANSQAAMQVYNFEGYPWGEQWGFSIWFRRTSGFAQTQALMGDMDKGYDGSWGLVIDPNPSANARSPTSLTFVYNTQIINSGALTTYFNKIVVPNVDEKRWHSFIVTGNGRAANAYLDNEPLFCARNNSYNFPYTGFIANSAHPFYIGGKVNGSSTFIGEMKGITLYKTFLSRTDVNILHERIINTLPTHAPTPPPTSAPTLADPPTAAPTPVPSALPTASPTASPTVSPTASPTFSPTFSPTLSTNDQSSTSSKGKGASGGSAAVGASVSVVVFAIAGAAYYYKYKRTSAPPAAQGMGAGDDIAKHSDGSLEAAKTFNPLRDKIPAPATKSPSCAAG
jgi:hypothetical protein